MWSKSRHIRWALVFLSFVACLFTLNAQNLKYRRENVNAAIGSMENEAIIKVESSVEGLSVRTTTGDYIDQTGTRTGSIFTISVDLNYERSLGDDGFLHRILILESPNSNRLEIDVPGDGDELRHATYYYTVTLPDKFPVKLATEYIFTKSSAGGIRLSYGGRYGGYLGYKWGKFAPNGICIDDVTEDCDVKYASELGFIRQSFTAGARIGLSPKPFPVYMFVGGGYGTYGRQWENNVEIFDTIYFYSDYIRGVDLELGASMYWNHFYFSTGVDALIGNGKLSVDYMIGVGLSF